jgi:hypothetical protein
LIVSAVGSPSGNVWWLVGIGFVLSSSGWIASSVVKVDRSRFLSARFVTLSLVFDIQPECKAEISKDLHSDFQIYPSSISGESPPTTKSSESPMLQ